jgi:hypothetical protein
MRRLLEAEPRPGEMLCDVLLRIRGRCVYAPGECEQTRKAWELCVDSQEPVIAITDLSPRPCDPL